ncbi:hypothetical protein Moror_6835 [Moniliophthora roreri MCA 2997]|uniref:Uncharacterized protein n=1 Tax=Moniliophthora roreri (strain MCA 2997) TaxID=1381753 RepID=V2XVR5_MONRO|nr:hypothetical protein Moror_6835 [Moniliophthora roreri MCA 2997]
MPPKALTKTSKPSASRAIVKKGPQDVQKSGKRADGTSVVRPTTERALILRNGKYGARGTGELILTSKMTGREKLDLLAEDLVEKAQKSLRAPFRIEECVNIAISQFNGAIDDVRGLKDPDLFYGLIQDELKARTLQNRKDNQDPSRNPTYIASIISTRIHNAYMLASAWKLVADSLCELQTDGISDEQIVQQLKTKEDLKSHYLVLYDMVNIVVDLLQTKFGVLAKTTPHYARYFKEKEGEAGEKETIFDWQEVREACRSFLDSIVVELCFPRAPYPKAILYQILHDAVDEAPKEARRFPQALWDAVGDLSWVVQLQTYLETPLLHPDAKGIVDQPREMPPEFQEWVDAQLYSEVAAQKSANFKDHIFPLERTKKADVLNNMWKTINMNYKNASGRNIDNLWGLKAAIKPTPNWHTYHITGLAGEFESDDEDDGAAPRAAGKKGKKKPLAIEPAYESDDSMPPLQDVSDTDDDWSDSDDSSDDSDNEGDDESGYNTDEEDELREMLREAMDTVHDAEWSNAKGDTEDPAQDEYKGNPFLKLLSSLRGRMFQSSANLKSSSATGKKAPPPRTSDGLDGIDEEDEEGETKSKKKKKKKPKKKKKKAGGEAKDEKDEKDESEDEETPAPAPAPAPAASPPTSPTPAKGKGAKTPTSPTAAKPRPSTTTQTSASASTFSLPISQTTAESARSYIKSENLDAPKNKVKSRPDHASLFSNIKPKGVLARLGVGKEQEETPHEKKEKRNFFASLRRKTRGYMHQILHTAEDETKGSAGMKWDTFVKVMEDVGFDVDPSTAGSSVKFTPRNSKDNPISFHKPHPDSTITPVMLKQFSKRLRDHYGWSPEDLE